MIYGRIDLEKTEYSIIPEALVLLVPPVDDLLEIYTTYCRYKKFESVMPLFEEEFYESNNITIGYYNNTTLVAFSLIRKYNTENVEAVQFAWNYEDPKLRLGVRSLQSECAYFKRLGYKYMYLGEAAEYKSKIDGFEILGPI